VVGGGGGGEAVVDGAVAAAVLVVRYIRDINVDIFIGLVPSCTHNNSVINSKAKETHAV
jgi:hypothetical protein